MDCISIAAGWIETRPGGRAASEPAPTKDGCADYQGNAQHQQPDLAKCQTDLVIVRGEQQHPDERERANTECQAEWRLQWRLQVFETTPGAPIGTVEPRHKRQCPEHGSGKED